MPSLLRQIAAALAAILFFAMPALAEKRVALVIGNGAYRHTDRLPNPKNDAEDVSAALRRTGFETIVGLDLDKAGMEETTIRFARAAREADVAIFYYSGHALQFNGVNYLMPVDARLNDEADLRRMARVDEIVADVQQAKNLRILVLDSCRDNPLAEQLKRRIGTTRGAGLGRGLAKIDSPQGMILAFSTQAGATAADGTGRNSPYTAAFLKHIESAEEIGTVFRRMSADVYEATKRAQLPELSLSLIGEFYLKGRPAAASQATPDVSALQERLKALEEQLRKKDEPKKEEPRKESSTQNAPKKEEPKVAVVAPATAPNSHPTTSATFRYLNLFGDIFENLRLLNHSEQGSLIKAAIDAMLAEFPSDEVRHESEAALTLALAKKGGAGTYAALNIFGDAFEKLHRQHSNQRKLIEVAINGMLKSMPPSRDVANALHKVNGSGSLFRSVTAGGRISVAVN